MKIDHYDHSSSEAESESEEADLEESESYPNAVYILVFFPKMVNSQYAFRSMRLDMGEPITAQIVYNSLVVDKEHRRSRTKMKLSLEGNFIIVYEFEKVKLYFSFFRKLVSIDPKSALKSIINFSELCFLSKSTIDEMRKYKNNCIK